MSGNKFYSPLGASERILANGRPLAQREFVTLTEGEMKDPHNARLIEEGHLIPVVKTEQTLEQLRAQAADLEIEGRSVMSKSALQKAITKKMDANAAEATALANAQEGNQ